MTSPKQGWQVLPMPGFNHGLNPGLNRVGQNSKNPVTVGKTGKNSLNPVTLGKTGQNAIKFWLNDYDKFTQYGNKYIHQNRLVEIIL